MKLDITTLVILLLLHSVVSARPTQKDVAKLFVEWNQWEVRGTYNEETLYTKVYEISNTTVIAVYKHSEDNCFFVALCTFFNETNYKITYVSPPIDWNDLVYSYSNYTKHFAFAFNENWNQVTTNQITLHKIVRTCTLEHGNWAWIITTMKTGNTFYFLAKLAPKANIENILFTFSSSKCSTQYEVCKDIYDFLQYHQQLSEWKVSPNADIYNSVRKFLPVELRNTYDPPIVVQRSFFDETKLFAKVIKGPKCALIALRVRSIFGQDSFVITHWQVVEEVNVEREVHQYIRGSYPFAKQFFDTDVKAVLDSVKMDPEYTLVSAFDKGKDLYGIYVSTRSRLETYKFVHFVRHKQGSLVVEKTQDGFCVNEQDSCEAILKYRLSHRSTDNTEGFLALDSDIITSFGLGSTTAEVQVTETCIVDDGIIGFYEITQNMSEDTTQAAEKKTMFSISKPKSSTQPVSVRYVWVAIISTTPDGSKNWKIQGTGKPYGTKNEMLLSLYRHIYFNPLLRKPIEV